VGTLNYHQNYCTCPELFPWVRQSNTTLLLIAENAMSDAEAPSTVHRYKTFVCQFSEQTHGALPGSFKVSALFSHSCFLLL